MDPDPGHDFTNLLIFFFNKLIFKFFVIFFSHIFVDLDPGSQNLEDPTDPDPKHWFKVYCCISDMALITCKVTRNHT